MRFDLHIHTCLSPCASLDMAPLAVVKRAREVGLHGIAVVDHNSGLNAPAWYDASRQVGLQCLYGLEITTLEEIHVLAIFDTVENALAMTEVVYAALPTKTNDPDIFGDQPVVNCAGEIDFLEERLLSAPSALALATLREEIFKRQGLFIAAHVDRPVFSFFSQLGVMSGNEGFDACEISVNSSCEQWRSRTGDLPLMRNSDAHYLEDIGRAWSEADIDTLNVQQLRHALQTQNVRCHLKTRI